MTGSGILKLKDRFQPERGPDSQLRSGTHSDRAQRPAALGPPPLHCPQMPADRALCWGTLSG